MRNTKVGRPIEKEGRVKLGLSVTREANDILEYLASTNGKTKSRVFEEAIEIMKQNEETIKARMENFKRLGNDALLDFDEYLKNRQATQNIKEVRNVG